MSYAAIEVAGVRKSFGAATVLDGVDFDVPARSVLGLLGPNGAGKTTTVRILSTLLRPDAGSVRICGHDVVTEAAAVRQRISLTGQSVAVDEQQTGRENLVVLGQLWRLGRRGARWRADELLARFDLADVAGDRVATYSGGMRRRLDLAMGLVGSPSVVLLDEPTTGLDPTSRSVLWSVVRQLVDDGVTIVLTTQYLEEADQLADRIVLLDGGRVAAEGSAGELKRRVGGWRIDLGFASPGRARSGALALGAGAEVLADGVTVGLPSDGSARSVRLALDALAAAGHDADTVTQHQPTLDDVFVALTGAGRR